ncbi:hypothetical protein [Caulobacter sp. S45]|jgi:hypothetical protein|uniref:hypothetical protein n=1 Tax=Caulobacter sp. S45 TaxID=1641861 RepID=UPI00131CCA8C|nr:hypothetical protein [Caulobacter sp. S45]
MLSKKILFGGLVALSGLAASQAHAQLEPKPTSLKTSVQIVNATTSVQNEVGSPNVSGSVSPAAPTSIPIGETASFTTTTSGIDDAGVFTYGSCRFNYSTIWTAAAPTFTTGAYSFSIGATPAADCSSATVSSSFTTGAHSVKFTITH